jgi:4-hydroxythreonine-4-phosphate dehydrogenase
MHYPKIKIGITHGDINGIGYEVIIKSLMDHAIMDFCVPVVYGSPKVAAYHRKALNIENFSFHSINSVNESNEKKANIINCTDDEIRVELGKSTPSAGESSVRALEAAVRDLSAHRLDALVTAPINKQNVQSAHFSFRGHTDYLQSVFKTEDVLMLMISRLLRVAVLTDHVPLSQVTTYITAENILRKLRICDQSMRQDFCIRKPKIAVLGINPHASDNGLIGREEQEVIIPAIERAKSENMLVFGPYPADGFFGSGNFTKFDVILAMYHDQGLIPFKTLVPDEGVNYTAGLPVIRTSPAHGTAFEIAGKGEALHGSFLNAMFLACDIHKNRQIYREITRNPLPAGLPEELKSAKDGG